MCEGVDTGMDSQALDLEMELAVIQKKIDQAHIAVMDANRLLAKLFGDRIDAFSTKDPDVKTDLGAKESIIKVMELRLKCLEMAERNASGFGKKYSSIEAEIIAKAKELFDFLAPGEVANGE